VYFGTSDYLAIKNFALYAVGGKGGENDMKYRIEFRSSRYEGGPGERYVAQDTGGNFHEFEAADDADAVAKAPAE
jgi:hypothetical protein